MRGGPIKKAATHLKKATHALESAWKARGIQAEKSDAKPIDRLNDNGWSSLFYRLDALASLPHDLYPRAKQAAILRDTIFPPEVGLSFLQKQFRIQWMEGKQRIDRVAEQKLEGQVLDLAGPEAWQEIKRTHALYGEALGITKAAKEGSPQQNLSEGLKALSKAIQEYVIQIGASIEWKKPASIQAAKAALAPIAQARTAALSDRGSGKEGAPEENSDAETPTAGAPSTPSEG